MGSEIQWLPHGQYKSTCNVKLKYNNTMNDLMSNGYYTKLNYIPSHIRCKFRVGIVNKDKSLHVMSYFDGMSNVNQMSDI